MNSEPQSEKRPDSADPILSRAALLVSSGTLLSRLTGLIRDVVIFTWLGISPSMDALVLALRIPGTFYRFVVDAGFIRLLVPRLVQADSAASYTAVTFLPSILTVVAAAILLWLFTPQLVWLVAPGFDGDQRHLAESLVRIAVFYIPLAFAVGYLSALLNSRLHYGIPAQVQVVLNLSIAAGTAGLALYFDPPHQVVVLSMIGGAVLQILLLLFPLWRLQALPRLRLALAHPAFRSLLVGLGLMLMVTLPQQLGLWVSFAIGSQVEVGAPSRLYLAERIVQLPLALIGIALATVVLPILSRLQNEDRLGDFSRTLDWGVRVGLVFSLPMATGLWLVGDQVLSLLFAWRRIDVAETNAIQLLVQTMLLSVPFAIITQLMGAGYFSRQRYLVPVLGSTTGLLALGLGTWYMALKLELGGLGVGLGASLGMISTALILMVMSLKSGQWSPAARPWLLFLLRTGIACGLMALALVEFRAWAEPSLSSALLLALEVVLAMVLYFGALWVLGVRPTDWYRTPVSL